MGRNPTTPQRRPIIIKTKQEKPMVDLKFIATLREMTDQAYIDFLEEVIDDINIDLSSLRPHLSAEMICAKAGRKEKLELLEKLYLEISLDK